MSEGSIPDSLFGPYPSRVLATLRRLYFANHYLGPQSKAEPQSQFGHPYATMASLPFGAGHRLGEDPAAVLELMKNQRPGSGAFSRGAGEEAGMKKCYILGKAGADTPGGLSETSPGMGTFGLESKDVASKVPTVRFIRMIYWMLLTKVLGSLNESFIPTQTLNPVRFPKSTRQDAPQSKPDSDEEIQYRIHKPHHEFPFSHSKAEAKQREGIEDARAAALAQLETAQHNVDADLKRGMMEILGMMSGAGLSEIGAASAQDGNSLKGPRQTFDTSTRGPSFSHILHQNGVPISARPSMHVGPESFGPGHSLTGVSEVFRIPFGVPIGMSIPGPLMVMRDSAETPGGLGFGMPTLLDIIEGHGGGSPFGRRPEDRSAYVETVEDVSSYQKLTVKGL